MKENSAVTVSEDNHFITNVRTLWWVGAPHLLYFMKHASWCMHKGHKLDEVVYIGGGNRGPWPLLHLRLLHRVVIFTIEKSLQFSKVTPLLSVASSTSGIANTV